MRPERLRYLLLFLVASSWVLAVLCYGRVGSVPELSRNLTVAGGSRWLPLYFALTVLAAFFLSQIGFGATAGLFSFLRGLADAPLLLDLAGLMNLELPERAMFKAMVLIGNSPFFLWALVLGAERSLYLLERLRGMPSPSSGRIFKEMAVLLSVSLLAGLACSLTAGTGP
jgi:hypothetical protein